MPDYGKIVQVDCRTGKRIEREPTPEEIAELEALQDAAQADADARAAEELAYQNTLDHLEAWLTSGGPVDRQVVEALAATLLRVCGRRWGSP